MLMGLGNGAVFKLVPEHFPKDTGTVTGLVGALGGLGGFFPPLLLGVFRDQLGAIWPGFVLLSATALVLRVANQRVFRPGDVEWTRGAADGRASGARTRQRRRLGRTGRGRPRGGDRRRLAQPAALRRRARRLHVRDAVCGVRHQLSVRDVAEPPADAHVLAARVAGVLLAARTWPATRSASAGARSLEFAANAYIFRRGRLRGPRALADHVGLPARGGDHVSAGLGLDPFRDGPGRPAHVPHVRLRHRRCRTSRSSPRSRS